MAEKTDYLNRLKRIETRVMRLCVHLGLDPTENKERLRYDDSLKTLMLDGFGTTIGDIVDFCRKEGIMRNTVTLSVRGAQIGVIDVYPPNSTEKR